MESDDDQNIPFGNTVDSVSLISGFYLYTNPPPRGYGMPAMKTFETVN